MAEGGGGAVVKIDLVSLPYWPYTQEKISGEICYEHSRDMAFIPHRRRIVSMPNKDCVNCMVFSATSLLIEGVKNIVEIIIIASVKDDFIST